MLLIAGLFVVFSLLFNVNTITTMYVQSSYCILEI